MLIYARALKPGEFVRIGEVEGEVVDLGLLSTRLIDARGQTVTVPNAVVVGSTIRNDSRRPCEEGVMVSTAVSLGYDVPWRQIHAVLMAAAAGADGVRSTPAPFVRQESLGDFAVVYRINVYVDQPLDRVRIRSELHALIQDACNEHHIQILSPHFHDAPDQPVMVPEERWFTPPAKRPIDEGSASA